MELDRELPSSSSLKQKLCSSICFSCFFNVHGSGGGGGDDDCEDRPIALARLLPELGERWRNVPAQIGLQSRRLAGEFREMLQDHWQNLIEQSSWILGKRHIFGREGYLCTI